MGSCRAQRFAGRVKCAPGTCRLSGFCLQGKAPAAGKAVLLTFQKVLGAEVLSISGHSSERVIVIQNCPLAFYAASETYRIGYLGTCKALLGVCEG